MEPPSEAVFSMEVGEPGLYNLVRLRVRRGGAESVHGLEARPTHIFQEIARI